MPSRCASSLTRATRRRPSRRRSTAFAARSGTTSEPRSGRKIGALWRPSADCYPCGRPSRPSRARRTEELSVELLARLSWVDLVIILVLAIGVFAGFMQGMIRYVLNALAVIVAFVLAAQLKGPVVDMLGFWRAFTPEGRELLIFVLLFFGFVIGGFFAIRAMYRRTRLPIIRQLD